MNRFMCISVTFLDPLFHGERDGNEPEWPPSPMRLFQALVAGAHAGCRNGEWSDAKAEAFRWLERREPPQIVTPAARPAPAYTLYVPNNDSDKKLERQAKVLRPFRMLNGQSLHYLWPVREDEWSDAQARDAVAVLCQAARHLLALGWGIDLVVGNGRGLRDREAQALEGERWRPWRDGGVAEDRRRVPKQGTLDDLNRVYRSFVDSIQGKLFRPSMKPRVFDVLSYRRLTALPPRPYVAFDLRNAEGRWRAIPQTDAVLVAGWLRHQACEAARRDTHEFEGGSEVYVAGHVGNQEVSPPRFSYLPVPTIGHPHADGMIRRVLVAEPHGSDGTHVRWARSRLVNASLVDTVQRVQAILTLPERPKEVYPLYHSQSEAWCSVTPVALPGHDDGRQTKAERLFLKAVQQAGLPVDAVEEFTLRKAPFWPDSQHPMLYRHPQDYLKQWPLWHAHVCFKRAIPGPVSIGVGRHCGLGVFAAEGDQGNTRT